MNHLDLFSGIGGFALAARWAEIETVGFCEKDRFCQKVLKKHWPTVTIYDNIETLQYDKKVDLLTAGFPCQPFSIAGKQLGKKDERYLWPYLRKQIGTIRPRWLILENVVGIVPYLDDIIDELEEQNYEVRSYIIPASAAQAPHKRERVWIIANTSSIGCKFRKHPWKERCIQDNLNRNLQTLQSEWEEFKPESWKTYNAQKWFESEEKTNNEPPVCRVDDGLPNGLDRNRALGNAIVPQIAYLFMRHIKLINEDLV